ASRPCCNRGCSSRDLISIAQSHHTEEETSMYQPLLGCGATKNFGMALMLGVALTVASGTAIGQDKLLPPPYQMAGTNHVLIGVVWDEATIRKALPPGITAVKEMTGAINIYQAEKGYVIGPYQSAYFWVDVEEFDSPEGIKVRIPRISATQS